MNNQGSWRNAYRQTLQKLKPAGVSAQTWKVFVDSVLMALVTANADVEVLSPGLVEILDTEYVEPEEFAYQGIILGLKLLTIEQSQAEDVNDVPSVLRTGASEDSDRSLGLYYGSSKSSKCLSGPRTG